ncbi:hypothetical protein [Sphaerisporangium perillae]|uniref:hypothetical protein n=1 Tax=Sphaerisporangium perillae TaxID=2935860 RepID=UPI00200DC50D|nr:hypothetical protein [Sphaerisporangium perillae]
MVPIVLKRREDDFLHQHEVLTGVLKDTVATLEGLGPFWGDDEHGRTFYEGTAGRKGFHAAMREIVQHVGNITTAYQRIGENVAQAGANLETAEWAGVALLAQVVYEGGLAVPTTKAEVR